MSLINDALKRAKSAQQKSQAAAPGPQLRPAEPNEMAKQKFGMMVPLIIAFLALVGLLFVWQARRKNPESQPPQVTPAVAANPVPETKPPVQIAAASVPTSPAPDKPVAMATPELKLQAIFYAPGHSSAIISGKTVKAGDVLRGFHVAAITQTSATLVSATETNVMTVEQ